MLTMNEKDKNKMLEAILNKNEAYQCKLWAVIMAGADWSYVKKKYKLNTTNFLFLCNCLVLCQEKVQIKYNQFSLFM